MPLAVTSPASPPSSDATISSTLGELPRTDVKLLMHPSDAGTRGIEQGDLVRIFNEHGVRQYGVIRIDSAARLELSRQGFDGDSVAPQGQEVLIQRSGARTATP